MVIAHDAGFPTDAEVTAKDEPCRSALLTGLDLGRAAPPFAPDPQQQVSELIPDQTAQLDEWRPVAITAMPLDLADATAKQLSGLPFVEKRWRITINFFQHYFDPQRNDVDYYQF